MNIKDNLNGDPLSWLLETDSPGVRYLALRDIEQYPENDINLRSARRSAHRDGPIAAVLNGMDDSGFWITPGPGYNPKYRSTVWALILMAQLGASIKEDKSIARGCDYLLEHALTEAGQFTTSGAPSGTVDCLQGNLAWSLLELGCEDSRLEKAFDWMARTVTGEGIAPSTDRGAEQRYYAAKCGPGFACGANNRLPCAWGAVKVMLALGKLPKERRTPAIARAIERGVDFLLSVDPATAAYPTGLAKKPSPDWWKFGFPLFYVTDILQIVEALAAIGYGRDPRLSSAITFILDKQDAVGRWGLDYAYSGKTWADFGAKKQPNKWVTLRALRVLQAVSN